MIKTLWRKCREAYIEVTEGKEWVPFYRALAGEYGQAGKLEAQVWLWCTRIAEDFPYKPAQVRTIWTQAERELWQEIGVDAQRRGATLAPSAVIEHTRKLALVATEGGASPANTEWPFETMATESHAR